MNKIYSCEKLKCKNTNSNYMCIDFLKNNVENNCWNYDKCKYFLTYGNLECFKYAHQNGCHPNISHLFSYAPITYYYSIENNISQVSNCIIPS